MAYTRILNLLFLSLLLLISFSCNDDDASESDRIDLLDCMGLSNIRGAAEINGERRWLSLADVVVGEGAFEMIYQFQVGGYRSDCSMYEEVFITFENELGVDPTGTYEIVNRNDNGIGVATGGFGSRVDLGTDRVDLVSGTATLREVGFFKYEVDVEAMTSDFTPVSLSFTNEF